MGRAELAAEMAAFGAEPFRARQLWHWIYHRGATDFTGMTSLAKGFRERLAGALRAAPAGGHQGAGLGRRHPEMAPAL